MKSEERIDEACEYLALAICHMCKGGQDQMNSVGKEINAEQENITNVRSNKETDSENVNCVEMLDFSDQNVVMHVNGTSVPAPGKSLKLQRVGTVDVMTKDDSQITSCYSSNTCTDAIQKDGAYGVYGNIFEKINSASPVHCIKQSNSLLYTISSDDDYSLSLLLPKELMLNMESGLINGKHSTRMQSKKKIGRRLCLEDFMYNSNNLESNSIQKDEELMSDGHEQTDSESQNDEDNLESKIIQTCSGRKTHLTFFSQTLNDDFEDKLFKGGDLTNVNVNSPSKKLKLEPEPGKSPLPQRKRGRPRKIPTENLVLDNNVAENDISVVHNDTKSYNSFSPQEAENCDDSHLQTSRSSPNPILSLITDHLSIKTTQEDELVKIMKEHQREHSNILKEICGIMDELRTKVTKNK